MPFDFAYTDLDLTTEVNRLPIEFGMLNALNIAPAEPKASRFVRIDYRNGQIFVLAATEPGAPGQAGVADVEGGVILQIPHFPHIEAIRVGDLDGVLQVFNGQVEPRSLDRETFRKLGLIRANHSITLEYIRLGMIKGVIKDGRGRTLYDLYTVFGITKKTVDFTLGTDTTDVRAKCEEVVDHIMTKLLGETSSGIDSIVSTEFFNKLITHAKVEKFWLNAQNTSEHRNLTRQMSGGNWGRVFEFGGIVFREYKGSLPLKASNGTITTERNVAANYGHAYPTGTMGLMRTFQAPAYHIDAVNEMPSGDPIFISTKILDHGEGAEMKSQTNRIAVCKQPECLVETITSN